MNYIEQITRTYQSGNGTEHSYRPALKAYLESVILNIDATNEPKRQKCGAPDFIITTKLYGSEIPLGYIETKKIGENLDEVAKSEQLQRYIESLDNFILTDYIDFHFFRFGEKVTQAHIAYIENGKICPIPENSRQLENLLKDFASFQGQTITSAKKLAGMMARKARLMRDVFYKVITTEEDSSLKSQLTAFRKVLIYDMSEEEFADIYAQTITYGLFTARLHDKTLDTFSRAETYELMPKSNPFLRSLFLYVATDLDDKVKWIVDALCAVYRATDVRDILYDFGSSTGQNDPVVRERLLNCVSG
jgi:hypothetical protein